MKSIIIISILRDLGPPSPTPGTSCLCSKLIKQISEQLAVKYRLGSHAAELVYFKPLSQWLLVVGVLAETYEVNQSMVRYLEELKDKTECEPGPRHTGAALGVLGPDLHILHSAALAPAGHPPLRPHEAHRPGIGNNFTSDDSDIILSGDLGHRKAATARPRV